MHWWLFMNTMPQFNTISPLTRLVVDSATEVMVSCSGVAGDVMASGGRGGFKCSLQKSASLQHSVVAKSFSQPGFKHSCIVNPGMTYCG